MNSRQRRGIILLILSVLCALGAFAGVLSVINDVKSKVGPEVTAYRVKSDIEPYTELGATQFEKVEMPERWLSENAVTDLSRVRGKIAVTTLKAGSLLQTDMIVDTPALRPGQQEVAIMIDAATGVAGKITPGSTVTFSSTSDLDVVVLDHLTSSLHLERKEDLEAYTEAFNALLIHALSPEDSLDFIAATAAGA